MLNHSCVPCRAKKLKCDGELPCSNCKRKGIEGDCHRAQRKARPRKDQRRQSSVASQQRQSHGGAIAAAAPSSPSSQALFPPVEAIDPNLASTSQHDTLLRLAREALGDASTCAVLVKHVYFWRVQSLTHACIDVSTVLSDIDLIFHSSSVHIEPDNIVVCMMAVALALQYLPKDGSIRMDRLTPIDGTLGHRFRQKLLWELSTNFARHQMGRGEGGLAHIQSLILLLIYDQMTDVFRDQVFDHAIRSAKRLGLNSIAGNASSPTDKEAEEILNDDDDEREEAKKDEEMKARTWWFLVTRSWFTALSTSSYSIHPIHFSTRLPQQNLSLDLYPAKDKRELAEKLLSVYSPIMFSHSLISLAEMIRSLVDQRLLLTKGGNFDQVVHSSFEQYWNKLPFKYSVAALDPAKSGEELVDRIARRSKTERWILHQLIFHSYLELYEFQPTEPIPEAAISLANHVLDIQTQVDNFCPILNSLRVNVKNIVKASSILVLDLMQNPKTSPISRSIVLGKVNQALSICRKLFIAKAKDFELITEILRVEEATHGGQAAMQQQQHQQQQATSFIDLPFTAADSSFSSSSVNNSTPSHAASHGDTPITDPASVPGSSTAAAAGPSGQIDPSEQDFFVWSNFYPSEAGLYPILQSDTVGDEWANLFESYLSTAEPIAAGAS